MKILLDSHLLVWLSQDSPRLPLQVRNMLEDDEHQFFYSVISLWELSIKRSLGKQNYQVDTTLLHQELLSHDYNELPLKASHALAVETLPWHHKDPFDRILIAQAISEGMLLLTSDETVARYDGPIRLVR